MVIANPHFVHRNAISASVLRTVQSAICFCSVRRIVNIVNNTMKVINYKFHSALATTSVVLKDKTMYYKTQLCITRFTVRCQIDPIAHYQLVFIKFVEVETSQEIFEMWLIATLH